ncbi:MAG: transposase [Bryobacterales bacterium]|nr:transposase [Bryobacterales bacterium]
MAAKAEHDQGRENSRNLLTSLTAKVRHPRTICEELYCALGEMENRIKEPLSLFVDRMSAAAMRANQLWLYLSAIACALFETLRRRALHGTELAQT